MSTPHPSDVVMAEHYERITNRLDAESELFASISLRIGDGDDAAYGTFTPLVASVLRKAYDTLSDDLRDLADQARTIMVDYRAHADGTYTPLTRQSA